MTRKEITDAFNSLFLDARKEYLEALKAESKTQYDKFIKDLGKHCIKPLFGFAVLCGRRCDLQPNRLNGLVFHFQYGEVEVVVLYGFAGIGNVTQQFHDAAADGGAVGFRNLCRSVLLVQC